MLSIHYPTGSFFHSTCLRTSFTFWAVIPGCLQGFPCVYLAYVIKPWDCILNVLAVTGIPTSSAYLTMRNLALPSGWCHFGLARTSCCDRRQRHCGDTRQERAPQKSAHETFFSCMDKKSENCFRGQTIHFLACCTARRGPEGEARGRSVLGDPEAKVGLFCF